MNNSTKRHAVLSIDDDSEDDDEQRKNVEIYKCNDNDTNDQRIDYLRT